MARMPGGVSTGPQPSLLGPLSAPLSVHREELALMKQPGRCLSGKIFLRCDAEPESLLLCQASLLTKGPGL